MSVHQAIAEGRVTPSFELNIKPKVKLPKLKSGDYVELTYGVLKPLRSYTSGGKVRERPTKREGNRDLYFSEGWYICRILDGLDRVVAIWRKTEEGRMERIWANSGL